MTEVDFSGHESCHLRWLMNLALQRYYITSLVFAVHDVLQIVGYEVDRLLVFWIGSQLKKFIFFKLLKMGLWIWIMNVGKLPLAAILAIFLGLGFGKDFIEDLLATGGHLGENYFLLVGNEKFINWACLYFGFLVFRWLFSHELLLNGSKHFWISLQRI